MFGCLQRLVAPGQFLRQGRLLLPQRFGPLLLLGCQRLFGRLIAPGQFLTQGRLPLLKCFGPLLLLSCQGLFGRLERLVALSQFLG